jgi:hypothetical protein
MEVNFFNIIINCSFAIISRYVRNNFFICNTYIHVSNQHNVIIAINCFNYIGNNIQLSWQGHT